MSFITRELGTADGPGIRPTPPRRTLQTGPDLLSENQMDRLERLIAADNHAEVEAS